MALSKASGKHFSSMVFRSGRSAHGARGWDNGGRDSGFRLHHIGVSVAAGLLVLVAVLLLHSLKPALLSRLVTDPLVAAQAQIARGYHCKANGSFIGC
ncbi:hypothetical protein FBZ87_11612 [Nitrospirillum amazonense]|uniref:Uncharacterized protein n=1 Tax=Nitrospirillum amazonense TaxID=28077 RepID=A0A560J499_9PROT|nr:hypothetical protein [Nitrospirillum amazonense]TWB18431.1 hypothetical protein FBZ89_11076 [Nitrospirillum amazonense]TWB66048.1 hypothetical protein FBZ87_11612 [Nitrospirillum amazonense]